MRGEPTVSNFNQTIFVKKLKFLKKLPKVQLLCNLDKLSMRNFGFFTTESDFHPAAFSKRRTTSWPSSGKSVGPIQLTAKTTPLGASDRYARMEDSLTSCLSRKYRTSDNTIRSKVPAGQSHGISPCRRSILGRPYRLSLAIDRARSETSMPTIWSHIFARSLVKTPVAHPISKHLRKRRPSSAAIVRARFSRS